MGSGRRLVSWLSPERDDFGEVLVSEGKRSRKGGILLVQTISEIFLKVQTTFSGIQLQSAFLIRCEEIWYR
jgi:hypothetical protein